VLLVVIEVRGREFKYSDGSYQAQAQAGHALQEIKAKRYTAEETVRGKWHFIYADPAGNSNVEESLRGTLCPVYATASSAESLPEPSLRCLQV